MPQSNTVVVKIGSTLVANTERLTPRFGFIQRMLEDVAKLRERGTNVILCSSGAVALGLKIVGERPETAGVSDKQAAAAAKAEADAVPAPTEAELKAARDAKYAARKMRRRKG